MGPKKAPAAPATDASMMAPRPTSRNDRELLEAEQGMVELRDTKSKWELRQQVGQELLKRNSEQIAVLNDGIANCDRMLQDLSAKCSGLLTAKAELEAQDAAAAADAAAGKAGKKGAPKGGAMPEEPKDNFRLEESKIVTDVLLRYYSFDPPRDEEAELLKQQPRVVCGAPIAPTGKDVPTLARLVKAEAQREFDARRDEDPGDAAAAGGKAAPKRPGGSAKGAPKAAAPPTETEEARPVTPENPPFLPAPRGIDKSVWTDVLRLRGKRLQVDEAIEQLKKELVPLQVRRKGLESMCALTDYACSAAQSGTDKLCEKRGRLKEIEVKEVEEYRLFLEEKMKEQQVDGGGGGKKKK